MRILHVIKTLDPAAGGPPMVATRLAAAQAGLGHDVRIVSYHDEGSAGRVEELMAGLPHGERVQRRGVPCGTSGERLSGRGAARVVAGLLPEVDFAHVHSIWAPILPACAAAARAAGVPYALVPHGMLDPWCMRQSRLKKKLALALGFRRMIDRATFLHTLNRDEQRLMAPLRLRAPAEVIPNGVFLDEFDPLPAPGTFRAMRPALGERPYVLFLSRLHYKKGLDHLAGAFAALAARRPDVHLVVAGPDDGARGPFEAEVERAGLADRVHLTGPIYGPDKLAALRDAACFCLPSRQEGFSIAITEALACGVPVVISEACHFPEVAEAGAGEVVPLEAPAVAEALLRVLGDPERRSVMARAARELVATRYTWPKIAAQTVQLYEKYLGES